METLFILIVWTCSVALTLICLGALTNLLQQVWDRRRTRKQSCMRDWKAKE